MISTTAKWWVANFKIKIVGRLVVPHIKLEPEKNKKSMSITKFMKINENIFEFPIVFRIK